MDLRNEGYMDGENCFIAILDWHHSLYNWPANLMNQLGLIARLSTNPFGHILFVHDCYLLIDHGARLYSNMPEAYFYLAPLRPSIFIRIQSTKICLALLSSREN